MYIFDSPLTIKTTSKKAFRLNLNIYRNTHHHELNKAKINYKEVMKEQIQRTSKFKIISVVYTLFAKTRHKQDISNILCIHDKFFMDALVEFDRLPSDNYEHLPKVTYMWGAVDKDNPRVQIVINPIKLIEEK